MRKRPSQVAAAAADSSTVPSSATTVVHNSTSSTIPGSPATSTTSVSLPAVVGNGTIPPKRDEGVLDEKSATTTEEAGTALTTSASTTSASTTSASTTSTATAPTPTSTTVTSPSSAPPKKSWVSLLKSSDSYVVRLWIRKERPPDIKCRKDIYPCIYS